MNKITSATNDFLDKRYIPLESKFKLILAVVILLLPVVIFYFAFFQPNEEKLASLDKKKITMEKKLRLVKKKAQNRARLQQELNEVTAIFEETSKLLPKEKEIPQLLKDISALGRNAGLDFLSFKPGKDVPKDFYAEIPVSIKVNGPYHNMGFFLDQVSKLNRIVSVTNVSLGGPKMDSGEMVLKSTCNLKTYRFTNKKLAKPKSKKKRKRK
jgi:type IV pilus assembly protein PilO